MADNFDIELRSLEIDDDGLYDTFVVTFAVTAGANQFDVPIRVARSNTTDVDAVLVARHYFSVVADAMAGTSNKWRLDEERLAAVTQPLA
ncbi:MAG: hypothetical protein VR70_05975 [Rhodospirillaceae bacterium BRH_c57]|nr:MAG: hypothetical protein VR70_05975 [Rhodospirillaceae bacterium BRH_c57]